MFPGINATSPEKLIRLWVHEVYRVFYDRLVDSDDRLCFFEIVKVCARFLVVDQLLEHLWEIGCVML